jgi:hypothetical protein
MYVMGSSTDMASSSRGVCVTPESRHSPLRAACRLRAKTGNVGPSSGCRFGIGKFPLATQNFGTRTIEPHRVVPAGHGRQAVGNFFVAASELDGDGTICVFFRCQIVERVSVQGVLLEIACGVVDADRPEGIDRHVLDVEPIDSLAVILWYVRDDISRILVGIAAPTGSGADQVFNRIDLVLGPEGCLKPSVCLASTKRASRISFKLA